MRCPNCQSVIVKNEGMCPYCGYDVGEYVRTVQDEGVSRTGHSHGKEILTLPVYNYENGYLYYKRAYEKEKGRNDRYKRNLLYGGAAIVLMLHFAELLALAAIYMG